jgi:hypothetical protein
MSDLIESSEFGDWLTGEIEQSQVQLRSAKPDRALHDRLRLEALKVAKNTLFEFLTLQQKMLEAAAATRDGERGAACTSAW